MLGVARPTACMHVQLQRVLGARTCTGGAGSQARHHNKHTNNAM